jgi:putative spermidine/putrescine transport system substrate-binding protein
MRYRCIHGLVTVIGLALSLVLTSWASAASFAGQTLRVQTWPTGAEAEAVKTRIVDPFVKATGANVVVEYGHTSQSIAKARAQKNDPQLDVILMDDVGVLTLAREGILDKIDVSRLPHGKDIYPSYFIGDGYGVAITTYMATILYNPKAVATPPTSWNDLWNPAYKGKFILPFTSGSGIYRVALIAAMLNGGGEDNLAPAWPKLRELKPNVHSAVENTALAAEAMRTGEAALTVATVPVWKEFIARGDPLVVARLKEGYFSTNGCVALVKGGKGNRDLAYAFMDWTLRPDTQKALAEDTWFGPTNRTVVVSPEAARYMIVTPEQHAKAIPVDLVKMLALRPQIVEEWTKIFSQ